MTHRSRLAGFIIDCQTDDLDAAARFWSGALGLSIGELSPEESATYTKLDDAPGDLHVEVQKVTHPSRVHLTSRPTTSKRKPRASKPSARSACSPSTPGA